MAKSEDDNFNEAVRRSMEEAKVLEAKKISLAEANSLIGHGHSGAKTQDEEDAQLARALAESKTLNEPAFAAAGGHHHKRPINKVEEKAHINMAELRSLKDAKSAAGKHAAAGAAYNKAAIGSTGLEVFDKLCLKMSASSGNQGNIGKLLSLFGVYVNEHSAMIYTNDVTISVLSDLAKQHHLDAYDFIGEVVQDCYGE